VRKVVIVGYDKAVLVEIACTADALDIANRLGAAPRYEIVLAGPVDRPMRCSSGLALVTPNRLDRRYTLAASSTLEYGAQSCGAPITFLRLNRQPPELLAQPPGSEVSPASPGPAHR